jgi:hypothetical protein
MEGWKSGRMEMGKCGIPHSTFRIPPSILPLFHPSIRSCYASRGGGALVPPMLQRCHLARRSFPDQRFVYRPSDVVFAGLYRLFQ